MSLDDIRVGHDEFDELPIAQMENIKYSIFCILKRIRNITMGS